MEIDVDIEDFMVLHEYVKAVTILEFEKLVEIENLCKNIENFEKKCILEDRLEWLYLLLELCNKKKKVIGVEKEDFEILFDLGGICFTRKKENFELTDENGREAIRYIGKHKKSYLKISEFFWNVKEKYNLNNTKGRWHEVDKKGVVKKTLQ